jgi:uncharacterized YigZ family protein
MDDTYRTIKKKSEGYFRDRGSKFYAFAFPVETEDEIKEYLDELRKKYYDARHHCYAYQLGAEKTSYRINDDGEPSSSAGKPIFGRIQSHDLTNILIVVIRYFGGVKLGVPGLINAYKTAAEEAILKNKIETKTINEVYELTYEYPLMNEVMRIVKDDKVNMIFQEFEMTCRIHISIRRSEAKAIEDKLLLIRKLTVKHLYTA